MLARRGERVHNAAHQKEPPTKTWLDFKGLARKVKYFLQGEFRLVQCALNFRSTLCRSKF